MCILKLLLFQVSNMYIVSLAVADLIVGMFVMPMSAIYIFTGDWIFGVAVCQIWLSVDYTATTASILNLFILSVDRYWSVTSPLRYLRKRTKKRAIVMISVVWFISCLWIVPIVSWHHIVFRGTRAVPDDVCDTEYAKYSVFKIITAFFNFYLPLTVMYSLYGKVFHEIRKRSALELGQNYPRPLENMQYVTENDSPTLDNSSSQRMESYSGEHSHHSHVSIKNGKDISKTYTSIQLSPMLHKRSHKKHKGKRHRGGFRLRKKCARNSSLDLHIRVKGPCKVEYIYDENVMDQKTEKLERFYYQEHIPLNIRPREIYITPPTNSNHSAGSSECTPSSSSEERRHTCNGYTRTKEKPNYSLVSGLRHIRHTEQIVDKTVSVLDGETIKLSQYVPRHQIDEHRRRYSNMFNKKHRIKNIRQSSLTKEIKAARQLGVIMGAFTVCFLPYFIVYLLVALCPDCVEPTLITALTWVGYLNSTLNPFLYPLCNLNFRRKFRKMLHIDRESRRRRRHNIQAVDRNSFSMRYD